MSNISEIFFILIIKYISCYSDGYNNLYNWLISNGGFISPKIIPVEQSIYNRYLITKEKINKNEEIIFIPNELTLSTLNNIVSEKCKTGFKEFISSASKEEKYSYDFDCLVYFLTIDMAPWANLRSTETWEKRSNLQMFLRNNRMLKCVACGNGVFSHKIKPSKNAGGKAYAWRKH